MIAIYAQWGVSMYWEKNSENSKNVSIEIAICRRWKTQMLHGSNSDGAKKKKRDESSYRDIVAAK